MRASRVRTSARSAQVQGIKKTSGGMAENALNRVYSTKYQIGLDHQILSDHSVFYPQVLYNDLTFELTLAPALQVVRGSDTDKVKYKLKNIQIKYEMIRSKRLADKAYSIYAAGKEFLYNHMMQEKIVPFPHESDEVLHR